jgi:hypothetical protein
MHCGIGRRPDWGQALVRGPEIDAILPRAQSPAGEPPGAEGIAAPARRRYPATSDKSLLLHMFIVVFDDDKGPLAIN